MEKSVLRKQICSMILVLALVSFFFFFPISESSTFLLTIPIALLSTIILVTLIKKKKRGCVEENLVQEKLLEKEESNPKPCLEYFTQSEANHEEDLNLRDEKDDEKQGNNSQSDSCSSSSLVSDSESSSTSSMMMMEKNCEIDDDFKDQNPEFDPWRDENEAASVGRVAPSNESDNTREISHQIRFDGYPKKGQNPEMSTENDDDDDEDEDSLIEIDLLSSSFCGGFGEEEEGEDKNTTYDLQLPESIFKHRDLMGLLAESIEMNNNYYEDYDNLIEIDISMDSTTKCTQDLKLKQEKLALLAE